MNARLFVKRNASTILTVLGCIVVVVTPITAVKAIPKALHLIEEAETKKGEKLTKWEKTRIAVPTYVPSVLIVLSTLACVVCSNILNQKAQASIMSAYALLDQSYKDYRRKFKELYGEDADQEIPDAIAIEKTEDQYISAYYFATNCDLSTEEHSSRPKIFYFAKITTALMERR